MIKEIQAIVTSLVKACAATLKGEKQSSEFGKKLLAALATEGLPLQTVKDELVASAGWPKDAEGKPVGDKQARKSPEGKAWNVVIATASRFDGTGTGAAFIPAIKAGELVPRKREKSEAGKSKGKKEGRAATGEELAGAAKQIQEVDQAARKAAEKEMKIQIRQLVDQLRGTADKKGAALLNALMDRIEAIEI